VTAAPSAGEQRKFLANTIKPGGVAGVPESYYRKALDLNRFSNSVANKLLESYRRQIVKAVRQLERIDKMPSSKKPQFKAARMRALIKQNLDAMKRWSGQSVEELIKQLDGLADIEVAFAKAELQRAVPAAVKTQVRTVEVTESFAKAVVKADPLDVGTNLLQGSFEEAVKGPGSVMKLTARQGAVIRMPDGTSIVKAFRGLAERQGELFSRAVLDGLLTGESTESIARSLYGELGFSTEALTPRQVALAQKGNAWKMAKHQVRTLVRTSVNATSNAASLQVYKANPKLTKKYRWIATLDSNTTAICRNLDQKEFFYGKGPTPANPPHFGCRSTTVPVIDYAGASKRFGVDIKPPSSKIGYRPTKEGTPSSADPKGGRVPVGTSAAQHLYDLRGTTKAGRKSRFEASPAQARMLNGGKATPGAFEKARYFNRLADRYGPEGAMKRFMREDGSEVSLKQLRSRYGQPDKITQGKKAAAPKPKPKPVVAPKAALKTYTGRNFDSVRAQQFNAAQKKGKKLSSYQEAQIRKIGINDKHLKQANEIESFLKAAPKYEGTVQRGMNMPKKALDDMLANYKAGGESFAMESWTSGKALNDFTVGADQHVILRAKNKRGVDIAKYSEFGNEKEVLMPTGSRYSLKGVQKEEISPGLTKKGIFRWIVDLEQE
jgi:SPP1 gp7 family putative phage head morphogenesis protein